jgi:hypothetical protein
VTAERGGFPGRSAGGPGGRRTRAPGAGPRRPARRAAAPSALLVVLGLALTLLGAGPAQAAGYRYWSFWTAERSGWVYAQVGPALARPADGSVHGFRFSVSEDGADQARPRTAPDFATVCGTTAAKPDTKRIALVIDPGTAADAPEGETPPAPRTACARVHPDATTAEALAVVAKPLRYDSNALLCAITGYPAAGCGERLKSGRTPGAAASDTAPDSAAPATASGTSSAPEKDGIPALGFAAGAAAVLLLGAAALRQSRRRRR